MSADKREKKPRIFIKKNRDEDISVKDEFYEYDKLKSKEKTIDESFFEDFRSVDFEQVKHEKEKNSFEEVKKDVFSSSDMIEDEVIQDVSEEKEILKEIEIPKEKEILNETAELDKKEEILEEDVIYDIVDDFEEDIKLYDKTEEDDDDDDFGSLEAEDENSNNDSDEKKYDSLFETTEDTVFDDKKEDENSIFNQYSIANDEDSSEEGNYDSLFDNSGYVSFENKSYEEDDDDDFGSLDDEPEYNVDSDEKSFVNVSQKSNYYNELKETDDEFEDEYEEDEDEYYVNKKGKKKKKRGGFRIFFKFLLAFLVACSAIAVYFGLTHDLFKIDYINITGNVANEKEILISKSGVSIGDNIFLASSSKIEKNLKEISNIESVKVRKNYPNIIEIEIKENYVSAYINSLSGLTTIDNYGKVKEVVTDNSKASGVQIKGISETGLKVGDDFSKDITKVKFLLDILTKEYYSEIVSIDFTNDKEIVLEFKNSLKVTFGDLKDYAKKTQVIGILIKKIQLEGINAKEIILNVGDNPIIVKK